MSKSILVMNTPENGCMDCDICRESFFKTICGITGNGVAGNRERGGFPEECPLKPIPEKKPKYLSINSEKGYCEGWNDCIDAIGGNDSE